MILNSSANVKNGSTLITRTSGDNWLPINRPAFFRAGAFVQLYMIAEVDSVDGQWMHLCRPYQNPTQNNIPVEICMDYTVELNLPVGNIGDVDMADIYNRAMLLLDRAPLNVALHGPTHVGLGLDPVPLASSTDSGLLGRLSGLSTDYVGGDNICHQLAGVPTGTMVHFAGANLPVGWLWCNGGTALRSVYNNLYTILGGTNSPWGQGDGLTTFGLPDARGMVLIGAGAGVAPAITNRVVSGRYGEEKHVLTVPELAAHKHPGVQYPHQHAYFNPVAGANTQPGSGQYSVAGQTYTSGEYAQLDFDFAGNNAGHNTVQPSLAVYIMIKT